MDDVESQGWTTYLVREETRDGREVQMPQWVMDHACANVDASRGAAVVADGDGGWLVTNCYDWNDALSGPYDDLNDARRACDNINDDAGIRPFVIPAHWAVIIAP